MIFLLDSAALEESTESHLVGQGQTWARSTAPTVFGGHGVSQGLRNEGELCTQMRNGLHCARSGEGCRLPSCAHGRAGLQPSQQQAEEGTRTPGRVGPQLHGWGGACTRMAGGSPPDSGVQRRRWGAHTTKIGSPTMDPIPVPSSTPSLHSSWRIILKFMSDEVILHLESTPLYLE